MCLIKFANIYTIPEREKKDRVEEKEKSSLQMFHFLSAIPQSTIGIS